MPFDVEFYIQTKVTGILSLSIRSIRGIRAYAPMDGVRIWALDFWRPDILDVSQTD